MIISIPTQSTTSAIQRERSSVGLASEGVGAIWAMPRRSQRPPRTPVKVPRVSGYGYPYPTNALSAARVALDGQERA